MIDTIVKLAQGNPGAMTVLVECVKAQHADVLLKLEALDCRGPDIWIAYKDQNGEDLEAFVKDILAR